MTAWPDKTAPLVPPGTTPMPAQVGMGQTVFIRRRLGDRQPYPAIVYWVHDDGTTIDATMFGPWGATAMERVPRRPSSGEWPIRAWSYTP